MTATEFARLLNARKVGRTKWMALCPAHPDRNRSLSIAEGRRVPVLLKCMSHGCDTKDILAALGMTWGSLFDGKPSPETRQRMTREEQRKRLERQLGLVIVMGAVEREKRRYWAAAERRIRGEIEMLRCWLEPEKVIQGWRERQFHQRVRKVGWDATWLAFEATAEGKEVARQYGRRHGLDGAGTGAGCDEGEIRRDGLHGRSSELQASWVQAQGSNAVGHRPHLG